MASTAGEGSLGLVSPSGVKQVVVRVKRKASVSRLEALWLEINERPLKRPLLDFDKLSLSESSGKEELATRKIFVRHIETVTTSETIDIVKSFVPDSTNANTPGLQRRSFRQQNKQEELLSKSIQKHEALAKHARFEQIWRCRKGDNEALPDKALNDSCSFYDVVRVDTEEKETAGPEEMSLEDQKTLSKFLPILREFIPSAAAEIESDISSSVSREDEYVYDYYTVKDDMKVDDLYGSYQFPLIKVEDEDFHDVPYESDYDSEDSNAENNPQNDYPDEMSEEDEESEVSDSDSDSEEENTENSASSKASEEADAENGASDDDLEQYSDNLSSELSEPMNIISEVSEEYRVPNEEYGAPIDYDSDDYGAHDGYNSYEDHDSYDELS